MSAELSEFLRSHRAPLPPQEAVLVAYGSRREVPAQDAGVSAAAYYTRLEQGQPHQESEAVFDAPVRALRLSADERVHLRDLALLG